jgi:hypothetical protein
MNKTWVKRLNLFLVLQFHISLSKSVPGTDGFGTEEIRFTSITLIPKFLLPCPNVSSSWVSVVLTNFSGGGGGGLFAMLWIRSPDGCYSRLCAVLWIWIR